jgi:hypothetical protein
VGTGATGNSSSETSGPYNWHCHIPRVTNRELERRCSAGKATRLVPDEPEPEQLAADMRSRAGHYEILGETYAKFEFFEKGWNPYSRFLDVDKVDLILRRRSAGCPTHRVLCDEWVCDNPASQLPSRRGPRSNRFTPSHPHFHLDARPQPGAPLIAHFAMSGIPLPRFIPCQRPPSLRPQTG